MEKTKKERGITLIALVIIIIVLLILAGVSIATLTGENGILTRASQASEQTKQANAKEQVQLAVAGSYEETGKISISKLNDNLKNIENLHYNNELLSETNTIQNLPVNVELNSYKIRIFESGNCKIVDNLSNYINVTVTENTYLEDNLGNMIIIPEGFKILSDSSTVYSDNSNPKVIEGIVIQDNYGNEFVWIPVGNISNGIDIKEITLDRYSFGDIYVLDKENYREYDENTINIIGYAIKDFKQSVKNNGGYYIARYEAGKDIVNDNEIVVSKRGEVLKGKSQSEASILCKNMYSNTNFTSGLINSYAWDTVIIFIQNFGSKENSSNYGLQNGTEINFSPVNTGENDDEQCNIFDLAGNYRELSTEYRPYSNLPIARGGNYISNDLNVATRSELTDFTYITFRGIIYLN